MEEKPGVAFEFAGRPFGRIRAKVMVATDDIVSRDVRDESDGLGGEGKPEEAGSGDWRGVRRGSKLAGVDARARQPRWFGFDFEEVGRLNDRHGSGRRSNRQRGLWNLTNSMALRRRW